MSLDSTEWESTIRMPISKNEYDNATGINDVIFLLKNGSRVSARCVQRKITLTTRNLFGFHEGHKYPITRTTAQERLTSIDRLLAVEKTTHRILQFYDSLRVSYNKEECEKGIRYSVEYEIEYPVGTKYPDILRLENEMMALAIKNKHFAITYTMSLENIFACVMSKVQLWHCFDNDVPYTWAYKWNGIKAKLMIQRDKDIAYIWSDAGNIRTESFRGNKDLLVELCLLVEIMDDRIVIIEVIGSEFDEKIYTTEPMTNVKILDYLKGRLGEDTFIGTKPVIVQTFYEPPKPKHYDPRLYDGFIIIQNDIIIKWKIPTIDVLCMGDNTYSVAGKSLRLQQKGEKGQIYEISPTYEVIRKRIDRIAPSTAQEFEMFMKSVRFLAD